MGNGLLNCSLGASDYFKRTENVAGVKDMRFQALMPDVS